MGSEFGPATPIRRFGAVWTDLSVFLVLWLGGGIYLPADSAPYAAPAFLLVNIVLTAFTGFSLGRALTGIRVVKAPSGGAIGLPRALLRALIVFATGWMLVFAFIAEYRFLGVQPRRMWWDRAAGSQLVMARRSSTFWNWSMSRLFTPAWVVPLLCLLTVENGQSPPVWMLAGFSVLLTSVVVATYAKNTNRLRLVKAVNVTATVAVLLLGIGVVATATSAHAEHREISIEFVYASTLRSGTEYVLAASDGLTYFLPERDFHPALPQLDSPAYRGSNAVLTVDSRTTTVLAIEIDRVNYVTATYGNPALKRWAGWGLGGLVIGIGIAMAIVFGRLSLRPALWFRRPAAPPEPAEAPAGRDATWQSYE